MYIWFCISMSENYYVVLYHIFSVYEIVLCMKRLILVWIRYMCIKIFQYKVLLSVCVYELFLLARSFYNYVILLIFKHVLLCSLYALCLIVLHVICFAIVVCFNTFHLYLFHNVFAKKKSSTCIILV